MLKRSLPLSERPGAGGQCAGVSLEPLCVCGCPGLTLGRRSLGVAQRSSQWSLPSGRLLAVRNPCMTTCGGLKDASSKVRAAPETHDCALTWGL